MSATKQFTLTGPPYFKDGWFAASTNVKRAGKFVGPLQKFRFIISITVYINSKEFMCFKVQKQMKQSTREIGCRFTRFPNWNFLFSLKHTFLSLRQFEEPIKPHGSLLHKSRKLQFFFPIDDIERPIVRKNNVPIYVAKKKWKLIQSGSCTITVYLSSCPFICRPWTVRAK